MANACVNIANIKIKEFYKCETDEHSKTHVMSIIPG